MAGEAGLAWRTLPAALRAPYEALATASKAEYARLKREQSEVQASEAAAIPVEQVSTRAHALCRCGGFTVRDWFATMAVRSRA